MNKKDVIDFLNFRKKFNKKEWFEINKVVMDVEREKADKLKLDDHDLKTIVYRLSRDPFAGLLD